MTVRVLTAFVTGSDAGSILECAAAELSAMVNFVELATIFKLLMHKGE